MGKRLDTLERSANAPEKETSNTQYRGGGNQNHRGHGDKNSSN